MNDLRNFVEAAGCRTMSEASRRLEITQPSLSESIKRLESDLGCVLFYRSRSGVRLTPAGKSLLEKAKGALASISEIGMSGRPDQSFSGRSIVIGCHPVVGSYVLPRALSELQKLAPDFRVELRHGLSREIQGEVQAGLIDLAVIVNPSPVPDLVIRKKAIDEVAVWTNGGASVPDRVLCDPELFQTQSILRRWKKHPANIMSTHSLELVARLTAQGLGYGILPARVVQLLGCPLNRVKGAPVYKDEIAIVHRPEFGRSGLDRLCAQALSSALAIVEGERD